MKAFLEGEDPLGFLAPLRAVQRLMQSFKVVALRLSNVLYAVL